MYNKQYYDERRQELQNEAVKIKLRYADKAFQLSVDLNQDLSDLNNKIVALNQKEAESKKEDEKKTPAKGK